MGRYSGAGHLVVLILLPLAARAAEYTVLDVQSVPLAGDPARAAIQVTIPERAPEVRCDVLIAGAGMGGIGAALAVADRRHSVCLAEETDWVGGQATAGGVPALDENRFIEFAGAVSGRNPGKPGGAAGRNFLRNPFQRGCGVVLRHPGDQPLARTAQQRGSGGTRRFHPAGDRAQQRRMRRTGEGFQSND